VGSQRINNLDADRVPLATWIILGVAGAVFAAAAWISTTPPEARALVPESPAPSPPPPAPEPVEEKPIATDPLNIAPLLLDAESRSFLWNPDSVLAAIKTVIGPEGPLEPIEIQFAVSKAGRRPGAPLKSERLTVRYTKGRAEQRPEQAKTPGLSVPIPNCPLEAAARTLPARLLAPDYRLAVLYSFSKKESRPLWLFTEPKGTVHRVDGDSCAVLVR
jgi:hypothetical protein